MDNQSEFFFLIKIIDLKKKRFQGYDERKNSNPDAMESRRKITKSSFLNKTNKNSLNDKIKNFTENYSEDDISILSTFDPIE
ncbi:hypothetical protein DDB_G0270594 [Dictyostelium discoideum AX4]|uniref:Uncharacterized protein n=1 Tax=Dictyostelium discoideum TaxID=44689 RepID=Q55DH7_DICDI|nr:hypothetical protein DDB_G0270594 [Dictyostelium discoideum AX4]EAL72647.1 hypothetical protein DDB_G0270594 [Dictyostelium discoideum AX4]|eukprot:XP_646154.1 hypothetical protein DDB_G0270594 [Dictyostelium discoideum AX4]